MKLSTKLILICCSVWFVTIIGRYFLYYRGHKPPIVVDTTRYNACVDTISNDFPNHSQIPSK